MENKTNHGGVRNGAGRKPKEDELKIIERLDNIIESDEAIKSLKRLIADNNFNAIKLYFEYRFGKPKETIENINRNYDAGKLTEEEAKMLTKVLNEKY
jgi:hypothetical protein